MEKAARRGQAHGCDVVARAHSPEALRSTSFDRPLPRLLATDSSVVAIPLIAPLHEGWRAAHVFVAAIESVTAVETQHELSADRIAVAGRLPNEEIEPTLDLSLSLPHVPRQRAALAS